MPEASKNLQAEAIAQDAYKLSSTGTTVTKTSDLPELDASDLPWDIRIHSGAKTKSTKGMWKRRKNVDAAIFESVTNELLGKTKPEPEEEDDDYEDDEPIAVDPDELFGGKPGETSSVTQTEGTGKLTHGELMQKATKAMTTGYIDIKTVNAILSKYVGSNGIPAQHLGLLGGAEYADCIGPVAVAMSQHVICVTGGTW
jgi:hypothetical protein